jgi:hypothetical protein
VRTEAQKQVRAANDQVEKLQEEVAELQIVDQDNLFDLVIQDRDKDVGKKPIDLLKALDMRLQGHSLVSICKECDITLGRLRGLLKRYDCSGVYSNLYLTLTSSKPLWAPGYGRLAAYSTTSA